jgi:hypothetical protein
MSGYGHPGRPSLQERDYSPTSCHSPCHATLSDGRPGRPSLQQVLYSHAWPSLQFCMNLIICERIYSNVRIRASGTPITAGKRIFPRHARLSDGRPGHPSLQQVVYSHAWPSLQLCINLIICERIYSNVRIRVSGTPITARERIFPRHATLNTHLRKTLRQVSLAGST